MSRKDWWFAAGTMTLLGALPAAAQTADQKVGIVGAVNPEVTGALANAPGRVLFVGNDVFRDEHITTGANGQTHMLFLDQSALTVGPNSDMVLDRFVYDPDADTGQLAMSATRGVARYIGGKISKKIEVTIRTPTATIGIRGGMTLLSIDQDGATSAVFLHGVALTVTGSNGEQEVITRPGFFTRVAGQNVGPTSPAPAPSGLISSLLGQLAGPSRQTLVPAGSIGVGGSGLPPGDTAPDRIINILTPQIGTHGADTLAGRQQIDANRTLRVVRDSSRSS